MDRADDNTAQLNLAYSKITAPIDGRVGLRPVDVGNYIATTGANGIATITHVTPIDVEFTMPQDPVPKIQERVGAGATLPTTVFDRTRTRSSTRHVPDARQPDRPDDRHDQGEGAVRERGRRAVPEPVRQRAAAAAT